MRRKRRRGKMNEQEEMSSRLRTESKEERKRRDAE